MKPNGQRMVSGGSGYVSVGVNGVPSSSAASRPMRGIRSGVPNATARQTNASRLVGGLFLALFFSGVLAAIATTLPPKADIILEIAMGLGVFGVVTGGSDDKRIKAGIQRDSHGNARVFTLSLGGEVVALDPGMSWTQVDKYKWGARGLFEEPQSFHVLPNGTVEINAEKISPADPEGTSKLEREIIKRHAVTVQPQPPPASAPSHPTGAPTHPPGPDKVHFRVKLDRLGHLLIECVRGAERVEASMRGIPALIANGLLLKPGSYHVDPMQRAVEIDGVRFECTEAGAQHLADALNARYAPSLGGNRAIAIEIRENLAATTGFDIHFKTVRAGVTFEINGHLSQENLDILQDPAKCDLLQPGIQLRLSPPHLLIRRRRSDGGEEKIPELQDVHYRQVTAVQLQQILNHPLIRRSGGATGQQATQAAGEHHADIVEMRVTRNPANKMLLWLECVTTRGGAPAGKAFTHHNIADLQHAGCFLPQLDVCLSLDHRKLSVLNRQTNQEETITIDTHSSDQDLIKAGGMLTNALKPPPPPPAPAEPAQPNTPVHNEPAVVARDSGNDARSSDAPTVAAAPVAALISKEALAIEKVATEPSPKPVETPSVVVPAGPKLTSAIAALFCEADPVRINLEIFRRLGRHFGIAAQDIRLSLPCVFENRRFEVISFEHREIGSVMELRAEDFYGFYLSHIKEQKVILVYACNGAHIEWGPDKCVLQPSVKAEPDEYKGSALLGFAQDRNTQFVFVVQPAFKEWVKPREQPYTAELVHFVTAAELDAAPDKFTLIWPVHAAPQQ